MDFPKDYHWKRKANTPQSTLFPKTTLPNPNPHSNFSNAKGRVRIEQYEYEE